MFWHFLNLCFWVSSLLLADPRGAKELARCSTVLQGVYNETAYAPEAVTRTVRVLGGAGGPYREETLHFPNARYTADGHPPILSGLRAPAFVYDVSASSEPIGQHDPYTRQTYGAAELQRAIQRYLRTKDFNDGTLDFFVSVRPGDPDPSADLARIYRIAAFFGTGKNIDREGPRGMARNPEAKRNLRIFVVESQPNSRSGEVPPQFLRLGSDLAREFRVTVAVSNRYAHVDSEGHAHAPSTHGWIVFSPDSER